MPEFLQPQRLENAVDLLRDKPDLRILAGGTDVIVQMRDKAIHCRYLMDAKRVPELSVFRYTGEGLEIGGAVTCNDILAADWIRPDHHILKEAAATLANTLLRNRATVMGNICNASPGGDMIPACLVLEGKLITVSPRGEREIPLQDFFTGPKKHVLAPDELALRIVLKDKTGRGAYLKKRRIRGHDLAQVGVAGYHSTDQNFKLAFAAVGPVPIFIDYGTLSKQDLLSQKNDIIDTAERTVSPIADVRASREYRLAMLRLFVGRIVDAFGRDEEVER